MKMYYLLNMMDFLLAMLLMVKPKLIAGYVEHLFQQFDHCMVDSCVSGLFWQRARDGILQVMIL